MGDTEELIAAIEAALSGLVEEGLVELATRRGVGSLAARLLPLLERSGADVLAGRLDLDEWLMEQGEVIELYAEAAVMRARLAPVIARMRGEARPPCHHPELVAAVERARDDVAARLVYADWLTEQGDPRGELIAIQAALLERRGDARLEQKQARLVAAHRHHFLGDLSDDPELVEASFRLGWLDQVRITSEEAWRSLADLAKLESARLLRVLEVMATPLDRVCRALAEGGLLDRVEELRLAPESFQLGARLSWVAERLGPAHRLESLFLRANDVELGGARLPRLRRLEIDCRAVDLEGLDAAEEWPLLDTLVFHRDVSLSHGDGSEDQATTLAPLLARPPPCLRRLALVAPAEAHATLRRRFDVFQLANSLSLDLRPPVPERRRAAGDDGDQEEDDADDDRYDSIEE